MCCFLILKKNYAQKNTAVYSDTAYNLEQCIEDMLSKQQIYISPPAGAILVV